MKIKTRISLITWCAAALLLVHCARQGSPTGGPKDVTPPKLDSLRSTPNFSTGFQEKKILLRFDEWITLFNPGTEVSISPPLNKRPEVTLKGKTVLLEFDKNEQLRPNTTYTVNYGASIKDLHEGNAVKDLRFVFSTGDHIDSLRISGFVMDAFTGEPVENISVMLYESEEDSIIQKEKPYYWGKTDKLGQYSIYNIKEAHYKALAIDDVDQNLKWTGESEKIAFLDSSLFVTFRSNERLVSFKLFKNQPKQRLIEKNANQYGLIRLGFTQTPENIDIQPLQTVPGLRSISTTIQDSIYYWYDLGTPIAWKLLVGKDTVAIAGLNRDEFLKKHRPGFADMAPASGGKKGRGAASANSGIKTMSTSKGKAITLPFSVPILSTDSSKWLLRVSDSIPIPFKNIQKSVLSPRDLDFSADWVSEKQHQLFILPGGITDFYGIQNSDTLRRNILHQSEKQLGSLKLTLKDLHSGHSYIVQVLNGNSIEAEQSFATNTTEHSLQFLQLAVSTYTLRLIEDRNNNSKWDTGLYYEKRQAERVVTKKLEAMRANWELEANISLEEASGKGKKKG